MNRYLSMDIYHAGEAEQIVIQVTTEHIILYSVKLHAIYKFQFNTVYISYVFQMSLYPDVR